MHTFNTTTAPTKCATLEHVFYRLKPLGTGGWGGLGGQDQLSASNSPPSHTHSHIHTHTLTHTWDFLKWQRCKRFRRFITSSRAEKKNQLQSECLETDGLLTNGKNIYLGAIWNIIDGLQRLWLNILWPARTIFQSWSVQSSLIHTHRASDTRVKLLAQRVCCGTKRPASKHWNTMKANARQKFAQKQIENLGCLFACSTQPAGGSNLSNKWLTTWPRLLKTTTPWAAIYKHTPHLKKMTT